VPVADSIGSRRPSYIIHPSPRKSTSNFLFSRSISFSSAPLKQSSNAMNIFNSIRSTNHQPQRRPRTSTRRPTQTRWITPTSPNTPANAAKSSICASLERQRLKTRHLRLTELANLLSGCLIRIWMSYWNSRFPCSSA
jgi:hypothetical protein